MKKLPFHVVVLGKMAEKLPLILSSSVAEEQMSEFADILLGSIFSDEEQKEVIDELNKFIATLRASGDEKYILRYLEKLVEKKLQ